MIKELSKYYLSNGISALIFHCPNFSSCSQRHPTTFTTAKEAFVSTGYAGHKIPRLVFISLDSGSAETDPTLKTLESIRFWEEEKEDVLSLPKNKHWYRTHELAYVILRNFKNELKLEDARHYFAHINSAKCCENNPGRGQASQILFDNCRRFIPRELEILDPDIIITQGKWGKLAMQGAFPVLKSPDYVPSELREIFYVLINSHPVIWIETYHPRHSGFHITNRPHYALYEQVIRDYIQGRSNFTIEPQLKENPIPTTVIQKRRIVERAKFSSKKKENHKVKEKIGFVTGYIELPGYPDFPPQKFPTRADCEGYEYMSMVQLCNIAQKHGRSRSSACNAFGGDKGSIPVLPERQARISRGHIPWKFVLVSPVEKYFNEIGIDW